MARESSTIVLEADECFIPFADSPHQVYFDPEDGSGWWAVGVQKVRFADTNKPAKSYRWGNPDNGGKMMANFDVKYKDETFEINQSGVCKENFSDICDGEWVDALSHLNISPLKQECLHRMGDLYARNGARLTYCEAGSCSWDAEKLANALNVGQFQKDERAVLNMLTSCTRGWMWQEIAINPGAFDQKYANPACKAIHYTIAGGKAIARETTRDGSKSVIDLTDLIELLVRLVRSFNHTREEDCSQICERVEMLLSVQDSISFTPPLEPLLTPPESQISNSNYSFETDAVEASFAVLAARRGMSMEALVGETFGNAATFPRVTPTIGTLFQVNREDIVIQSACWNDNVAELFGALGAIDLTVETSLGRAEIQLEVGGKDWKAILGPLPATVRRSGVAQVTNGRCTMSWLEYNDGTAIHRAKLKEPRRPELRLRVLCPQCHPLVMKGPDPSGWACDARNTKQGCKSGCTDFHQSSAWTRWTCSAGCDWDLCGECVGSLDTAPRRIRVNTPDHGIRRRAAPPPPVVRALPLATNEDTLPPPSKKGWATVKRALEVVAVCRAPRPPSPSTPSMQQFEGASDAGTKASWASTDYGIGDEANPMMTSTFDDNASRCLLTSQLKEEESFE